jgi:CRP/FNR family transcriptional regulator
MPGKNYIDLLTSGRDLIPDTSIFNYLTDQEKLELSRKVTFMNFSRHDILFKQGMPADHVVFINEGLIKVFKGGRGPRLICIRLVGPGNLAGFSSVFGANEYKNSAAAIENTQALMIRKEGLSNLIKTNGSFALALFKMLSMEVLAVSDKLVNFSMKQLPGKVADLLRYFSEDIFNSDDFTVPLTRQELAELIGTTKESLIRTLNEFKNDKIIELDGKNIRIISKDLINLLSKLG